MKLFSEIHAPAENSESFEARVREIRQLR
jgi:hypothetical protein